MSSENLHTKEFLVGAVVGSLLGGVAALLTTPLTGREVREDFCEAYEHLSDKAHEFADKGKSLVKDLGCCTDGWACKAKSALDSAKTVAKECSSETGEWTPKELIIGGLVGCAIGAAMGILLAPKSGNKFRKEICDACEGLSEKTQEFADQLTERGKSFAKSTCSNTSKWLSVIQHFVEKLTEDVEEKGESLMSQAKETVNNKRVGELLEWAELGYRVWQGVQSKKKGIGSNKGSS